MIGLDYSPFDLVIIPDGIGIYPGLSSLVGLSIPDFPVCSYAEYFRITLLDKYLEKQVPIIGIGHGAAMLTPHAPVKIGCANKTFVILDGDRPTNEFEVDHLLGVYSDSHPLVQQKISEVVSEIRAISSYKDDNELGLATNGTPPAPKIL